MGLTHFSPVLKKNNDAKSEEVSQIGKTLHSIHFVRMHSNLHHVIHKASRFQIHHIIMGMDKWHPSYLKKKTSNIQHMRDSNLTYRHTT